jgi:tetrahydromethanopterin S-methyltransferase subunit B
MKLADESKAQAIEYVKHASRIEQLEKIVADLQAEMATREQLEASMALVAVKMDNLHADLTIIKNAIYAVVGLLVSTTILAVLALVFRQG